MRRLQRVLASAYLAGSACALLAVTLIWSLAARVPNVLDERVVPPSPGWATFPVESEPVQRGEDVQTRRLTIKWPDLSRLVTTPELRVDIATFRTSPRDVEVALRIPGTRCEYRGKTYKGIVELARGGGCAQLRESPSGDPELVFRLDPQSRVGVWTWLARSGEAAVDAPLVHAPYGIPGPYTPLLDAKYVERGVGRRLRRIDLLAYLWDLPPSLLWSAVLAAVSLILGGWLLALRGRMLIAAFCLALGLGGLYAVIIPPLNSPDEPDHLLSFGMLVDDTSLAGRVLALGRKVHLQRIRFHADEKFRPADVGAPYLPSWDVEVHAEPVAARSITTSALWRAFSRAGSLRAEHLLAAVRAANAVVFALALAAAVVVCHSCGVPAVAIFPLFLIPTMPFFASGFGETAILTSMYVLFTACVAVLFVDSSRSDRVGLFFGLSISLLLLTSRGALPLGALIASLLLARTLLGTRAATGRIRSALIFWGGLLIGLAVYLLLANETFRAGLWPPDSRPIPESQRRMMDLVRRHPSLILAVPPLGFAVELMVGWIRSRIAPRAARAATLAFAWLSYAAAAAIAYVVVSSFFVAYPQLPTLRASDPGSAIAYGLEVLRVAPTALGWQPDLMLFSSFWGGFGWIDALPPSWFIGGSAVLLAGCLAAFLVWLGMQRDARRFTWVALLACGLAASLFLYAMSTYLLQRNVHGRYIQALYMVVIVVTTAWLTRGASPGAAGTDARVTSLLIAMAVTFQAICLSAILGRYF